MSLVGQFKGPKDPMKAEFQLNLVLAIANLAQDTSESDKSIFNVVAPVLKACSFSSDGKILNLTLQAIGYFVGWSNHGFSATFKGRVNFLLTLLGETTDKNTLKCVARILGTLSDDTGTNSLLAELNTPEAKAKISDLVNKLRGTLQLPLSTEDKEFLMGEFIHVRAKLFKYQTSNSLCIDTGIIPLALDMTCSGPVYTADHVYVISEAIRTDSHYLGRLSESDRLHARKCIQDFYLKKYSESTDRDTIQNILYSIHNLPLLFLDRLNDLKLLLLKYCRSEDRLFWSLVLKIIIVLDRHCFSPNRMPQDQIKNYQTSMNSLRQLVGNEFLEVSSHALARSVEHVLELLIASNSQKVYPENESKMIVIGQKSKKKSPSKQSKPKANPVPGLTRSSSIPITVLSPPDTGRSTCTVVARPHRIDPVMEGFSKNINLSQDSELVFGRVVSSETLTDFPRNFKPDPQPTLTIEKALDIDFVEALSRLLDLFNKPTPEDYYPFQRYLKKLDNIVTDLAKFPKQPTQDLLNHPGYKIKVTWLKDKIYVVDMTKVPSMHQGIFCERLGIEIEKQRKVRKLTYLEHGMLNALKNLRESMCKVQTEEDLMRYRSSRIEDDVYSNNPYQGVNTVSTSQ